MYLGSAVLGGHLVLGLSVWGTRSPRTNCPGGHVRGGTCHTMTPVTITRFEVESHKAFSQCFVLKTTAQKVSEIVWS